MLVGAEARVWPMWPMLCAMAACGAFVRQGNAVAWCSTVLLRLAYPGVTNVFALLRLLPMSSRDKDAEILALRHQLSVLQRQLTPDRVRFTPGDRALLAALLHQIPRDVLKRLHLVVRPDTVLRWHRDVVVRRHSQRSRPRHPGRPRTVHSVRVLVLRLVRENPGWGYRRVHGELLVLGVKVAASTVWEILHDAGIDPAPERSSTTWAASPGRFREFHGQIFRYAGPAGTYRAHSAGVREPPTFVHSCAKGPER